jgi:hypothetical protein
VHSAPGRKCLATAGTVSYQKSIKTVSESIRVDSQGLANIDESKRAEPFRRIYPLRSLEKLRRCSIAIVTFQIPADSIFEYRKQQVAFALEGSRFANQIAVLRGQYVGALKQSR